MRSTSEPDLVRFTSKGQVIIPEWLRKQFQIQSGTKAIVQATSEGILLKPVPHFSFARAAAFSSARLARWR